MRKILAVIFFLSISTSIFSQNSWMRMDSVNGPPRSSCASFVLKGEGFVVGGLDVTEFKRKMYSYDVDQDDWDSEESLGGPNGNGLERGGAIGFAIGSKAYIGLGQGNTISYFSDFWEYDSDSKSWTQKADFIGSARRQAVGFSIDSIGYVGTGQDINGLTNDFYKYDRLTNTWTQLNDFAGSARKGAVGFSVIGQGYIATGDAGVYTNDFWMYHHTSDSWEQKPDFPGTPRTGAVGWGSFPSVFIACGYDNTLNYKKDVWEYNYYGDQWQQRTDFTGPARTNSSAFSIDGIGYIGLGYNGGFLDDFYAYTPILSDNLSAPNTTVNIYPNPSSDFINVKGLETLSNSEIIIYDINGKITFQSTLKNNQESLSINCSDFSSGIYICKISSGTFSSQTKLIIH